MSNTINRLEYAANQKLSQWDREAFVNAVRAFRSGKTGSIVTYPTGKQMVRFAEPFKEFGMHYEVSVDAWNSISSENCN